MNTEKTRNIRVERDDQWLILTQKEKDDDIVEGMCVYDNEREQKEMLGEI